MAEVSAGKDPPKRDEQSPRQAGAARALADGAGRSQPPRLSGRNSYSIFVGLMKVLLPALAVGLIILVIAWPQIAPDERNFNVGIADISPEHAENLSMLNARFTGVDRDNQPFNVTADMATQSRSNDDLLELQTPEADITLKSGAWLALEARQGFYQRETEVLDLRGEVALFRDDGLELHTESARIDLKSNSASGDEPIRGQGPFGTINGQGFRVEDGGARVTVTGRSRMVIYPGADSLLEDNGQ